MRNSGAGRRIGFAVTERNFYGVARAWRKRRLILGKATKFVWELNGSFLTDSLDRSASDQKHLENWVQIARVLSLEPDYTFPWMTIEGLPAGVAEFVTKARAEQRPLCAVHAGGRLPTKRWPLERFQALLDGFFQRTGSRRSSSQRRMRKQRFRTANGRLLAPQKVWACCARFFRASTPSFATILLPLMSRRQWDRGSSRFLARAIRRGSRLTKTRPTWSRPRLARFTPAWIAASNRRSFVWKLFRMI